MNRSDLLRQLNTYSSSFPEELLFLDKFRTLLAHPDCYSRDHLPGHLTGSAWVLNQDLTKVLLLHHVKLKKWLQPGGHADGDENIYQVALKELREETDLTEHTVLGNLPFDIDIHLIPARGEMPAHHHYDIRFAFHASDKNPLLMSDESKDLQWVPLNVLEQYNAERSIIRMKEKTMGLLRTN